MRKVIIIIFCSAFLWGYQQNHQEVKHDENHQESHLHEEKTEQIELDNGARWLVNTEMKPFVISGEKLVDNFISDQKTDYVALAVALFAENNQLKVVL